MNSAKSFLSVFIPAVAIAFLAGDALGQKVRFTTPFKTEPHHALALLAGEEKGFWKKNGLEVQWIPFTSGTAMLQAIAAGSVDMGSGTATSIVEGVSRGVAYSIVADLGFENDFLITVRADSPVREVKDLKGKKVGVPRLGVVAHAYGLVAARAAGLEKEIKFVGAGGLPQLVAGLKAGAIDATVMTYFAVVPLKHKGEVRTVKNIRDYMPKEWIDNTLFARREFQEKSPEATKRMVRAYLQAADYVNKNLEWSLEKMQSFSGFPLEAAREAHGVLRFSKDGKIDRRALENIRNFLIDYGLLAKEKAPRVEELYTGAFSG